jgi:hypothetical protein
MRFEFAYFVVFPRMFDLRFSMQQYQKAVFVVILGSVGAWTVGAEALDQEAPMDELGFRTLVEGCAGNVGNVAASEKYVAGNGFVAAPSDFAAHLLKGEIGKVWLLRAPNGVAVVTHPDGLNCQTYVQHGDVEKYGRYFKRVVEGIARPGIVVEKTGEREIKTGAGPAQYLAYRVGVLQPKPGMVDRLFSLTTIVSPSAPFSVRMTVAAAKPASPSN